ncbi:hypothetical protein M0805_006715 [Coniferiporia weirii]|nr:hypothetical protein M0805_006715 [Coniferiporia weirii]
MAPSFSASDTSEDDDDTAPEAVTLAYSKNIAKGRDVALRHAESELKRKRKEKNRLKDESLKRRAEQTRGIRKDEDNAPADEKNINASRKGKGREPAAREERSLEDRMDRAMREAQDQESDSDEALEAIEDDVSLGGAEDSESSSSDDGELSEDSGSDRMDVVEEGHGLKKDSGQLSRAKTKTRDRDYLPEHIFAAALSNAQLSSTKTASPASSSLKLQPRQKTKKRKPRTAEDVVLGSKTVHMLSSKTTPAVASAASRTLPPGRVKRFFESHLDLKSKRVEKSRRGWERKAANVGSLRSTNLPATNFARNPVGLV